MTKKKPTDDAVEILHRRYVKDDPGKLAELEKIKADDGLDCRWGSKIDLEFLPDVIVYFCYASPGVGREEIWGDELFYRSIEIYVHTNLTKDLNSGWIFIEKSTLNHKVIPGLLYEI